MTPEELLRQGKLDECLAAVEQKVRSAPADPKLRIMLFQVLAVMGQWDRAQNQLQVAAGMDQANLLMAQVCKQAILCEHLRNEVWAGKRSPLILGEPEEWLSWMVQALAMSAKGQHEGAGELRGKAFEAAPAVAGSIVVGDGGEPPQPIEWIADADERLGPILEALVDGKYYWIPWQRIALVRIDKPNDLRDTVWLPAQFVWTAGGQSVGLIPSRYPGSESKQFDAAIRMARKTEFIDDGGLERPVGQRLLATNIGEFGLLEVRSIRLGEGDLNPEGGLPGNAAGLAMDSSLKPGQGGGAHG
jgi:type VI secretion system protein ImpE